MKKRLPSYAEVRDVIVPILAAGLRGTLPGDVQKNIAKKDSTIIPVGESAASALAEMVIGAGVGTLMPYVGAAMAVSGVTRVFTMVILDEYTKYKDMPVGSMFLEMPYQAYKIIHKGAKKARSWFASASKEAEQELTDGKLEQYSPAGPK